MFVEGTSPSTHIRSRFPLHPRLRLWMEHPSRGKVNSRHINWQFSTPPVHKMTGVERLHDALPIAPCLAAPDYCPKSTVYRNIRMSHLLGDTPLTRSEGLLGLTPSYLLRALEN